MTRYSEEGEMGGAPVIDEVVRVAELLPRLSSVSLFQHPIITSR